MLKQSKKYYLNNNFAFNKFKNCITLISLNIHPAYKTSSLKTKNF